MRFEAVAEKDGTELRRLFQFLGEAIGQASLWGCDGCTRAHVRRGIATIWVFDLEAG